MSRPSTLPLVLLVLGIFTPFAPCLAQNPSPLFEQDDSLGEEISLFPAPRIESPERNKPKPSIRELAIAHPDWALDIEPAYMASSSQILLPDARETAFVPAIYADGNLRTISALRFILLDSLADFVAVAREHAEQVFAAATITPLPGDTGYRFDSADPRLSNSVMTDVFHRFCTGKMGASYYLIIPARGTIFACRASKKALQSNTRAIVESYNAAEWSVSLEFFRRDADRGLVSIGMLEAPRP